ncbi:hypothetical protein AB0I77_10065 [Streptomyces sp. NPDC050619]|uniref:hypothetical protein n=1 Tax=Streptomyces sp. NPDC050619 TaxID=3157214 RepID=UPI00341E375F
MAMNIFGLIGWLAAWIGLLAVLVVFLSPGFSFLFVPFLIYSLYRAVLQLRYFPPAFRMRRILQTYPWQILRGVPSGLTKHPEVLGRQYGWFELPNPARPEQRLPLVFPQHLRTEWWSRRLAPRAKPGLKAQIEVVWFAGDPRFIGLIAAPTPNGEAPRRLHVLQQQSGADDGRSFADWGATPEDIERGRRVGIHPSQPDTRRGKTS